MKQRACLLMCRCIHRRMRVVFLLLHAGCALAGWNLDSRSDCVPARYPNEGDGYCSSKINGWNDGGVSSETDVNTGKGRCKNFLVAVNVLTVDQA